MALENNLVVDSDAELKAFLSSILSSEGIVVNINRTFIAYNNGTNRNRGVCPMREPDGAKRNRRKIRCHCFDVLSGIELDSQSTRYRCYD